MISISNQSKFNTINLFAVIGFIFFLSIISLNSLHAQTTQDTIPIEVKNNTTIGFSVLNSAYGVDPFSSLDLFSPDRLTLANQFFIEQELFSGFGIMFDALYFSDKSVLTSSAFDDVFHFKGFQFEIGLTKNIFKFGKLQSQLELAYNYAPQTYENIRVPRNGDPENLVTQIEYSANGMKISSYFQYDLNVMFSLFFKSSLNRYTLKYEDRENTFTKFFPLDALGICKSF